MSNQSNKDLKHLYENLDFENSYKGSKDQGQIELERRVEDASRLIEAWLSGTIAYYRQTKGRFKENPTSEGVARDLEGMVERLRQPLVQYKDFTHP
jgi:hypothetical protein